MGDTSIAATRKTLVAPTGSSDTCIGEENNAQLAVGDTLPLLTGSSDTCIGEENTTHLAMGDTSIAAHW